MLNCLVIGSGIAGLATAISLQKAGHNATVFEAYSGPSDGVGGFLTVAVNGFDALETLELKEAAASLGFSTPQMSCIWVVLENTSSTLTTAVPSLTAPPPAP